MTTAAAGTAVGFEALRANTTGADNSAVGHHALLANTTGFENSALGQDALLANTTGSFNTGIGADVLTGNTTGGYNTAVGDQALYSNTIGSYRSALGVLANGFDTNRDNNTGVGYNANPTASNQVRIGNTSVTSIGGQVSFTTFSDQRFKTDAREDEVVGLDFILALRPRTYRYDIHAYEDWVAGTYGVRDENDWPDKYAIEHTRFTGFFAQEVEAAAEQLGFDFSGVDAPEDAKDVYGLRYAEFVVPLVKAVQELARKGQEQQQLIDELRDRLDRLQGN